MKDIVFAFDFDGVIADSVGMLYDAFCHFMDALGLEANKHLFDSYDGMSLHDVIRDIKEKNKVAKSEETLLKKYYDIINAKQETIALNQDVEAVVKELFEKGYTLLISSSAKKEYIARILERNNIKEYFEEIITIDEYEFRTKPSPDLYAYIAKKYLPKKILAIEDSKNGLIAAFNAGIRVICYNNREKKISAPYHYKISSFRSISDVVAGLEDGFFLNASDICLHFTDEETIFTEQEKAEIERIWDSKQQDLFNGNIVGFKSLSYENNKLHAYAYKTCYKEMYACNMNKNLNGKITPLAVSAITIDKNDNILLSRRQKVTEYVGCYELIPSGGIEVPSGSLAKIDYKEQIMQELREELGIINFNRNDFIVEVLGICYDGQANDLDICMCVRYNGTFDKNSFLISEEYSKKDLEIVPYNSIHDLLGKKLLYTSNKILNALLESF